MINDHPNLAAFLVVVGVFSLGLQDAMVKLASSETSLWHFQFFRSAFNIILLTLVLRIFLIRKVVKPRRLWAVALRSSFMCGAMITFFSGVPFLSLSEIASGLYMFPLFVVLLSYAVLGEKVGPQRIGAVALGFLGTLLILKPGADVFSPIGLLPVCAGFFYACALLTTRKLCREESPITLVYGVALVFLAIGAVGLLLLPSQALGINSSQWPYVLTGWRSPELWVYGVIGLCSILNLIANISLAKAYQSAESSWLVPFDYSYLVFATFWGFVIWRHIPDLHVFIGMLLIAGSGLFIAWRQHERKKY